VNLIGKHIKEEKKISSKTIYSLEEIEGRVKRKEKKQTKLEYIE